MTTLRAKWADPSPDSARTWLKRTLRPVGHADLVAGFIGLVYAAVMTGLLIARHDAFHTFAFDLGKFDQAIWSTSQGSWYAITLGESSVLQGHFSPGLALIAPLMWLWPNIRLLFILHVGFITGAGLLLYVQLRPAHPWIGLALFAAFLMNPTVHQVTLINFRRESLAILTTSIALYALLNKRHRILVGALLIGLLCKEDQGLLIAGIGLYLLAHAKTRMLGLALVALGAAWLIIVPGVILPALEGTETYGFSAQVVGYLGDSPREILLTLMTNPGLALSQALQPERLQALFVVLAPTLFLFILGSDVGFLMFPFLGYLLLSLNDSMGELRDWYPSIVMVILWWAAAIGIQRLPADWRVGAAAALLPVGLLFWFTQSQLWPGPNWEPTLYVVSDHARAAGQVLLSIPADSVVAAQDPFVPHLTHRRTISLIPWIGNPASVDFLVMDADSGHYPLTVDEHRTELYIRLTDPGLDIVAQVDRFFVFDNQTPPRGIVVRDDVWQDALALRGYLFTSATADGPYTVTQPAPDGVQRARLQLFWEATRPTQANYSVFVHLIDSSGAILAQSDGWPADGFQPTTELAPGYHFRGVRYLEWPGPTDGALALRIGLYDSASLMRVPLLDGSEFVVIPLPP